MVTLLKEIDKHNIYFDNHRKIIPVKGAQRKMGSENSRKSYRKAIFLIAMLIIFIIFGNFLLKMMQSPSRPLSKVMFGMQTPNGVPFPDDELEPVKKRIAGFWESVASVDALLPFVKETDKIELKPNGIYWRVRDIIVTLPSGDSSSFTIVSTGFINPYFHSAASPESLSCQVHFISEAIISANDTCYVEFARVDPAQSLLPQLQSKPQQGQGIVDTIWDFVANGKRFEFANRIYTAYDTSGAALASFFPKGITGIVNKISLKKCRGDMSLDLLAKRAIAADLSQLSVPVRAQQDILAIVDTYYKTMCAQGLAQRISAFKKGSVSVSFSVTAQGKVENPKVLKSKPLNLKLNKELEKEIGTWLFPTCRDQKKPEKVSVSFSY
jgi:hypothetical protein